MRIIGVSALILAVLSFFLWLISWAFWNIFYTAALSTGAFHYVAQGCSFLSTVGEFLAIALLCIGMIMANKRATASET